ncbi:MAG: MBL fold metallo-hydrolase [Bacilli bacterium]|nr:MBL fold metallo-hydrolase [Bacilli bacterium]MDD4282467.1 MBL fold metallo-hydrolase [Bacilli bacterium]MDD4718936.1 MBL fold metallo-hydrolase [Bacilli bacterium]
MLIKRIIVGYLETNCYLLFKDNHCLIIDPGAEENKIIEEIKDTIVDGVLITHYHPDHIGALEKLKQKYNCQVYGRNNLEEKNYQIGNFNLEIIYTPGHTSDSVSYYFDNIHLFTGDFLFKGSIGRYDLPTGDYKILMNSLEKIKKYPINIKIYPGHGEDTNLKQELEINPYLNI